MVKTDKEKALAFIDKIDDSVPVSEDDITLMRTLLQESDRGCVLVGAAYLDNELEIMLRTNFLNNEQVIKKNINLLFKGGNALLGSFWAKTNIALALGLINNDVYNALDKIRDLRNAFAHKAEPVFLTDDRVAPIHSKLEVYMQKITKAFREVINDNLLEIHEAGKENNNQIENESFLSTQKVEFAFAVGFLASEIFKGRKQ